MLIPVVDEPVLSGISTTPPNSCHSVPSQAYSLLLAVTCHTSPLVFPVDGKALTAVFVPL